MCNRSVIITSNGLKLVLNILIKIIIKNIFLSAVFKVFKAELSRVQHPSHTDNIEVIKGLFRSLIMSHGEIG